MSIRPSIRSPQPRHAGFTLVELMVTVAVIGILAVFAVPSMTAMIANSRLQSASGELIAALQAARSEAVRRNGRIIACASASGTTCAASASRLVVFWRDPVANTTEIVREVTLPAGVQISAPLAGVGFRSSGVIANDNAVRLGVIKGSDRRCVTVMVSGVVNESKGSCP